ncbi:MAG: hypothetical protein A2451_07780, partial [Bdellovibrionales bacterium RIFOXYC2_FULL_39_8]
MKTFLILSFFSTVFFCQALFSALPSPEPVSKNITSGAPNAKKGGTLTYEAYEPNHINPINFDQAGSIEILTNWLFESLLDTDLKSGNNIPCIAEKWAISKDGLEFVFWINPNAKWFDGKAITTEDVKFSFEVYSMEGANSPVRKSQAEEFSKIEIIDSHTIKFTAKKRLFSNFEFLASSIIMPKHLYYYTDPEKLARNEYTRLPKGSGPYIIQSWEKGDQAVMTKNPNWWGASLAQNQGAYNFDKIIIKYVRDPQIAFERLKKGDLDYMPIRIGNTELWRQTKSDKSFTSGEIKALAVQSRLQQGYGLIGFNTQNAIFKDKAVRMALLRAVNRDEIIEKSLDGLAQIPMGPLFSVDNFNGKFKTLNYDPATASKELNALGWKDSDGDYILDKGGKPFSFTVLVPNARIEKEMLFIQNYWKNIGINANIKIMEYSSWRQLQDERRFDAIANGKSRTLKPWSVDPYSEWHSDNLPNGLKNYYGYSNPKVDQLIISARQEFDAKKRKKILDEVNDIIADEHILLQYSESKYSLHGINSKIVLPNVDGKNWYPYDLGMK